ncbi:ABC transporter ATP-binding protein [Burkholderia sp. WAC0059]|uniref:ABC transporter ATP-binding protein/permease n=1 Tax=Burkholderia sp. WAC0059 TaxID=2066022 RepID=UPI000C7F52E6|nr:ABC transporter ATP-binding protein/permease [Burkholderia sp. WAC0059]PLZ01355.1 ABC transporter ATP-binding protein [Burkholderia sp. WAC0059]
MTQPSVSHAPLPSSSKISAWSLIKPYWISEEWKKAWLMLVAILAMELSSVWLSVKFNDWYGSFINVLQAKNAKSFPLLMLEYGGILFASTVLFVYSRYLRQMLGFRWRQWLTTRFMNEWLDGRAFYRIERDRSTDNPDQRISDDLQDLASTTLSLTIDLLSTLVSLVSFTVILWTLAGPLTMTLSGMQLTIPGYMVWAAAIYALVGSYVMHRFGHQLVAINYQQQHVEADFRFGLIRVRENAEQIAFYNGMDAEKASAQTLFERIRENWWRVMKYTKNLNFVLNFYSQLAMIFPFVVAAPRYFAGVFSFGALMQIARAFGNVSDSFSWFVNSYGTLAAWRATVNRLREFHKAVLAPAANDDAVPAQLQSGAHANGRAISFRHGIHLNAANGLTTIATENLTLALPDGSPLAAVRDIEVKPGARWLVRGPSGSGKSTLMRALAGLWPFGDGVIEVPVDARTMFVPQQSYLPIGTLKAALAYPSPADTFDDETCADALRACHLEDYAQRLSESGHWTRILSPGEQQRLAAARVLLHKPDFLFLDEATSALDPENEARLYRLFVERLPQTAIVSIAHRESLAAFHGETLDIERVTQESIAA